MFTMNTNGSGQHGCVDEFNTGAESSSGMALIDFDVRRVNKYDATARN